MCFFLLDTKDIKHLYVMGFTFPRFLSMFFFYSMSKFYLFIDVMKYYIVAVIVLMLFLLHFLVVIVNKTCSLLMQMSLIFSLF